MAPGAAGGQYQAVKARGLPSPAHLLPALALAMVAAGLLVFASTLPDSKVAVLGGNLPVNEGAGDPLDISANNSPALVRDPSDGRRLAVVNRIDSPRFSCALHVSLDAGSSWNTSRIPFPDAGEQPPRCFNPDAAYGADGTLHVSFVTLAGQGNVPDAVWLASSDDGGLTLSTPVRVAGPLAFQVRLAADPRRAERLYLSWLQSSGTGTLLFPDPGNPVVLARSDDGGRSWSEPTRVSSDARERVVAPSVVVAPGGRVYVLYLDVGDDRLDYHGAHDGRGGEPYAGNWSLVLARSDDRGRSWREAVPERRLVPTERFIVFLPPSPSLAVSGDGHVYVGFQDGRLGDADVRVWASEDGARFGPGVRVNDTSPKDGTAQYLPRLAVAPGGRLDAVYYDRRADRADVMNEVSLQSSTDGGRTFGPRVRLSDTPFDSRVGFGNERDLPDLGSRLALLATDDRALAVWTDTRAGTEVSRKQDLARAVVAFTAGSDAAGPLRVAGLAVALLAVAVGARSVARARRSGSASPVASPAVSPPDAPPVGPQP